MNTERPIIPKFIVDATLRDTELPSNTIAALNEIAKKYHISDATMKQVKAYIAHCVSTKILPLEQIIEARKKSEVRVKFEIEDLGLNDQKHCFVLKITFICYTDSPFQEIGSYAEQIGVSLQGS